MTSLADRSLVVQAFDSAVYPAGVGQTLDTAWLGVYQTLWWYEHGVLHLREANDLKKPIWQARAANVEAYVASAMGIPSSQLQTHVDLMMNLPRWKGMQRNNPLGNGLRILFSELCERFGNPIFQYPEEEDATKWFPGITMPGRSKKPKLDVAVVRKADGQPQAVLSCKWSYKHDRISDPTNECVQYKNAAGSLQNYNLKYFVLTNELSVARLDKVLDQPCVDGLIHVHLPTVKLSEKHSSLMDYAIQTGKLMDMTDFVRGTTNWR